MQWQKQIYKKYQQRWLRQSSNRQENQRPFASTKRFVAVLLCSLADKVGTNPKEDIISILQDQEFNWKTLLDHTPDMDTCRAVSQEFVRQCKKLFMEHSKIVVVMFREVEPGNFPSLSCIPKFWSIWKHLGQQVFH